MLEETQGERRALVEWTGETGSGDVHLRQGTHSVLHQESGGVEVDSTIFLASFPGFYRLQYEKRDYIIAWE